MCARVDLYSNLLFLPQSGQVCVHVLTCTVTDLYSNLLFLPQSGQVCVHVLTCTVTCSSFLRAGR